MKYIALDQLTTYQSFRSTDFIKDPTFIFKRKPSHLVPLLVEFCLLVLGPDLALGLAPIRHLHAVLGGLCRVWRGDK